MGNPESVRKGVSAFGLAFGICFAAAGVAFVGMAALGGYTLAISGFLLPQWTLYLVAAVAILFGAYGVKSSLSVWKCASCASELRYAEAVFSAQSKDALERAMRVADASELERAASPERGGESFLALALDYCPKCGKAAFLSLSARPRSSKEELVLGPVAVGEEALRVFRARMPDATRLAPLVFGDRP
jgi:hypothetical protein